MEKKEIVKHILKCRRMSSKLVCFEESKISFQVLADQQEMAAQLLKELQLLNVVKLSLNSERMNWKIDRSSSFWETDCQNADNSFFKNNFRMDKITFKKLCALLPGLKKNNTNMREAIVLEKRIAISLYALGSSAEYRTIGNMFGVGKSTVCGIVLDFCTEVWRVLGPTHLNNFPLTMEKIEDLVKEFDVLGYPQCMGALDGCHIEIHPSHEDATDYYNYKGWYSIVLLALVDARCRFIYVSSGSPGRCNDSQIYQESSLKNQLSHCNIMADLKKTILDVDVPVHIIGDSAFRLSEQLMKPYPFTVSQSYKEKCFNYSLSKSRRVVENAFGQLKARFRRIGKGVDNAIKNANSVVLASCVLHNFLSDNNDKINENWMQALDAAEENRSNPEFIATLMDNRNNAERMRNAISEYLYVRTFGEFGDGDGERGDAVETGSDEDAGEMSVADADDDGNDISGISEYMS